MTDQNETPPESEQNPDNTGSASENVASMPEVEPEAESSGASSATFESNSGSNGSPAVDTGIAGADKTTESIKPTAAPVKDFQKDEVLFDAFMLGWQIVELKSRIQLALKDPTDFNLRISSIWRSIFNRIAILQINAFPESATADTLYEPPPKKVLPYLYPDAPDYANVGISQKDANGRMLLEKFKLFDITRRAINCLTLIYIKKEQSLIPDSIEEYQTHLVQVILEAAQHPGQGGGDAEAAENNVDAHAQAVVASPAKAVSHSDKDIQAAREVLTERTVKFLDAWAGYLRENYYVGGRLPNNDAELVAFEAGFSMSTFSWDISIKTIDLEKEADNDTPEHSEKYIVAWKEVFRDQAVVRLQHQISAISSMLDEAYYKKNPDVKKYEDENRQKLGEDMVMPNPDLPSRAIRAVKNSLDYWHRCVMWISNSENLNENLRKNKVSGAIQWSKPMRLALIEQANNWQTLMTGQQSLRAFNLETITYKLMQEVTQSIQENLRADFKGGLRQAEEVMKDLTVEIKGAVKRAGDSAINGIEELYTSYKRYLIPVFVVIGIIICIFLIFLLKDQLGLASGGVGGAGILATLAGYFRVDTLLKGKKDKQNKVIKETHDSVEQKVEDEKSKAEAAKSDSTQNNILTRIQGAAQETGKVILDAFNRAYKQIRIELTDLGYSAAVSYPLVEFFGSIFTLKGDEVFLTKIIWNGKDRQEQIHRVMSAAFGSIAVFISPNLLSGQTENEGSENGKPVVEMDDAAPNSGL